jgi:iron complex transport system ATP-binding protein
MSVLAARGLAIGWGGRYERVLASGIDLELGEGELAVLVGPNGAGKSTLLRTLVGMQAPLRGSVSLCGEEAARLTVEERSRRAASVFTDRYDPGYFTVFDIVAFGRYPYTDARGRLEPRDLAAVRGAIAAVGLGALAGRGFAELSDGERQKALIARAIAQDCPLLVLDEPTAFLDAPARVEVFHIARDLARASRKTVVLSTHDIDHALRYADRLWLMDKEHRFSSGAPEDLAMSGGIGRAFDGEGFRFDLSSGSFKSAREGSPLAVEIVGREGASLAWTERLVERLGLVPIRQSGTREAGSGEAPIARIAIEDSESGPLFAIRPSAFVAPESGGARDLEATSYDELASILSGIIRDRDPSVTKLIDVKAEKRC